MKPAAATYGNWTVLAVDTQRPAQPNGAKPIYLICKCQCGTIKSVRKAFLTAGQSTSCGCMKGEKIAETRLTNRRLEEPTYLSQRERRMSGSIPIKPIDWQFINEDDMRWMVTYRNRAKARGVLTTFDPM